MNESVTIAFVFAAFTFLVIQVNNIIRMSLSRRYLHRERITAMEKGLPVPDDLLVDQATPTPKSPRNTAVPGIVWTGIGLGILISTNTVNVSGFGDHDFQNFLSFLQVWAWPALMVGLGLLGYALATRARKDNGAAPRV